MFGRYRGRLIRPLLAEIARLDTAATEAAGSYDPDFGAVRPRHVAGARAGGRRELAPIRVRCQVDPLRTSEQRQGAAGNVPDGRVTLVFHARGLEAADLLEPTTGMPRVRVNDRLVALYTVRGELVQRMAPPLYATEVQANDFGLGGTLNLFIAHFDDRPQGAT